MKQLMFLIALFPILTANAETLEQIQITNTATLESCYSINPYSVKNKSGNTETKQFVDRDEIAYKCSQKAVILADQNKANQKLVLDIAEIVRKNFRKEASLKIFSVLTANDKTLKSCDNSAGYSALKAALAHPKDFPTAVDSDLNAAFSYMSICIKDPQFLKDIQEDTESDNTYVKANLCNFLKTKNIKAKCQ